MAAKAALDLDFSDVIKDYRAAAAAYECNWRLTDDVLYRLCRDHYRHSNRAAINAKLLIIGRSYATGVERAIKTNRKQGGSLSRLADWIERHSTSIDALFSSLAELPAEATLGTMREIVALHGQFLAILKPLTQRGQSLRSFASKYMHFHCPTVPIYDNIAAAWMPSAVRMRPSLRVFELPPKADWYYTEHVFRTWHLYEAISKAEPGAAIRMIDQYVLFDPSTPQSQAKAPTASPA